MEEKQRSVDLVGSEKGALVDIQILACPRIRTSHRHLAVGIAPVAFTPVARVVADARVGDCRSEYVGDGLQILRHEAAVRSTDTADFRRIDPRMLPAEFLRSLDNIIGHTLTGSIHMARRKLLTKAGSSARIEHIDHVAELRVGIVGITALEIASRRRATAVIVDDHRVFARRIERRGQIVAPMNAVAARVHETPGVEFAKLHVGKPLGHRLVEQRGHILAEIQTVKTVGILRPMACKRGHSTLCRNRE